MRVRLPPTIFMKTVADQVREELAKRENTPDIEIAKATGIHAVNLSHFRAARRGLSSKSLERLVKYLGLEVVVRPARRKR